MSIKTLIQEAMNKNPLAFEEALKEELSTRIALALEAKMAPSDEEDDDEECDDDESDTDDDESDEDEEDKK